MRTYLDCYPCFLGQALEASRMAGADEAQQRAIVHSVLVKLQHVKPSSMPPRMGQNVHRIVREQTGNADPYRATKARSTKEALELLPWMNDLVDRASDPLETAVRLSIAGNIIDAIPGRQVDLQEEMDRALSRPLTVNDVDALRAALDDADWVLFLADNAGETVCDRPLINLIEAPVTYAVKGSPIANDATMEDALAAGVDEEAEVVANGSDAAGTLLATCSRAFRETFRKAPLIIAKGQANYECLSEAGRRVFFLLQTKCPVVARDVGVPQGSTILRQGQDSQAAELNLGENPS